MGFCLANPLDFATISAMKHYLHEKAYRCALVSDAVYEGHCLANLGLPIASDAQIKHLFGQNYQKMFDNCLLTAEMYHDTHDDSFILAFRGSADVFDWFANVGQYLGADKTHYKEAKEIAQSYTGRETLYFTGHSLGGGLATVATIASGQRAYVFNPPRINEDTIDGLDVSDSYNRIRRYVVKGEYLDFLNTFNKPLRIWTHEIGEKIELQVRCIKRPYLLLGGRVAPIIPEAIRLHKMKAVLDGLRRLFA